MYASDKTLVCQDCNQEFVFSASEQQFYADRQFSEPRRCPSCRAARKAQRGDFGGGPTRRRRSRWLLLRPARDVLARPARAAAARPRSRSARAARSRSTAATASPPVAHSPGREAASQKRREPGDSRRALRFPGSGSGRGRGRRYGARATCASATRRIGSTHSALVSTTIGDVDAGRYYIADQKPSRWPRWPHAIWPVDGRLLEPEAVGPAAGL